MKGVLRVASATGLFWFQGEGEKWERKGHILDRSVLTCVDVSDGAMIVGKVDGVIRSLDSGANWQTADQGLPIRHARWVALHPEVPGLTLLGQDVEPWPRRSTKRYAGSQRVSRVQDSPEAVSVRAPPRQLLTIP